MATLGCEKQISTCCRRHASSKCCLLSMWRACTWTALALLPHSAALCLRICKRKPKVNSQEKRNKSKLALHMITLCTKKEETGAGCLQNGRAKIEIDLSNWMSAWCRSHRVECLIASWASSTFAVLPSLTSCPFATKNAFLHRCIAY